ncbi:general substrate transporter, partial [Lineolata rhizophorae]
MSIRLPPRYVIASIICSLGGLIQGIDTGIIGPVTVMKNYTAHFGKQSAEVHGIVVSSILLSAFVASFFAGRPADVLGRPQSIACGAAIFGTGAALQAGATSIGMFIAARVIEGIGEGLYFGTLTIYICEISPPSKRGALTTGPQLCVCFGLLIGYFTCYGTGSIDSSLSWRIPFILLTVLSFFFTLTALLLLPPSPRWLTNRGREATATWDALGVKHEDREKIEDEYAGATVLEQTNSAALPSQADIPPRTSGDKVGFSDLFASDVRGRTMLGVFLMSTMQLGGVDAILYYAPLLFEQAGLESFEASFLASGISAIVICAVSVPALLLADKWGRRQSTLLGGLGLTGTMLLMGSLYASNSVHSNRGAARWVVIVCIYLYAAIFASSWAVAIKVYAPEIQPQRTRAGATSLAHGANWACNFFVAFICPILLARSSYGAYFLFGSVTALTTLVGFLFMVETRGKPLDEIEAAFSR